MLLTIGCQYVFIFGNLPIFTVLPALPLPLQMLFMAFPLRYFLEGDYYWAGGDRILEKGTCTA